MSRSVAVAVVVGFLLVWGGGGWAVYRFATRPSDAQPADNLKSIPPSTHSPTMPFERWEKNPPDLLLLFTGQQVGRLKPCGCAPAFQKGGLAKRATFFRFARAKNWPLVAVDLGGIVDNPQQSYGLLKYVAGPEHRLAKLEISLEALHRMGYDAVGLGPQDVNLEGGLLTYVGVLEDTPAPTITNCNLSIPTDLHELFRPYVIVERDRWRVGVLAVVGPKYGPIVQDELTPLSWVPPDEAIPQWLPALQDCGLRVLLFYGELDEARSLVRKYPEFQVVIYAEETDEPSGEIVWEGETALVTVSQKGKYVGALGIWTEPQWRVEFEVVALDGRFEDDPEVRSLVYGKYLDKLEGLQLVQKIVKKPLPEGAWVAGVEACEACHPRVVQKWRESKHALGLVSLKKTGEHVNPECLACHTTMFGYQGGYDGTPATAHLGGNQCENCHGPAGQHVEDPENITFRQALHLESVSAEAKLCVRCHDAENDPEFNFSRRWAEVVHTEEARKDALEYRRKKTSR